MLTAPGDSDSPAVVPVGLRGLALVPKETCLPGPHQAHWPPSCMASALRRPWQLGGARAGAEWVLGEQGGLTRAWRDSDRVEPRGRALAGLWEQWVGTRATPRALAGLLCGDGWETRAQRSLCDLGPHSSPKVALMGHPTCPGGWPGLALLWNSASSHIFGDRRWFWAAGHT